MELLEKIWEIISGIGNGILSRFERAITAMFGSANARFLKRLQPRVAAINALEPMYQSLSDEELAGQDRRIPPAPCGWRNDRRVCWWKPSPPAAKPDGAG